jgi:mono/diheme cytochrome c family protein
MAAPEPSEMTGATGGPVTEIPEHLRKRTQDRRRALGLPVSDDGGQEAATSGASAETAVAASGAAPSLPKGPAAPAVSTPAEPPAPAPVAPYVAASEKRRRIPFWVLPVLLLMPVWAFVYGGTLSQPASSGPSLLEEGAELYAANCAACHGGSGGGGAGPAIADGAVLATFSNPADQLRWIVLGSAGGVVDGVYGDNNTPSAGGMPGFGANLSEEELALIVRHERETLSGETPDPEAWLSGIEELGTDIGLDQGQLDHLVELIELEGLVGGEGAGGE